MIKNNSSNDPAGSNLENAQIQNLADEDTGSTSSEDGSTTKIMAPALSTKVRKKEGLHITLNPGTKLNHMLFQKQIRRLP